MTLHQRTVLRRLGNMSAPLPPPHDHARSDRRWRTIWRAAVYVSCAWMLACLALILAGYDALGLWGLAAWVVAGTALGALDARRKDKQKGQPT